MHPLSPPTRLIDAKQFGRPSTGAAFLVGRRTLALVEAGTAASAEVLLSRVRGMRLEYVFLTHAHLDHAGGAGHIATCHPEATVVAHPRAIPHLADPRRLIAGVQAANPEMFAHYGEPVAVPVHQLRAAEDGEEFRLGRTTRLQAIYSPGHAPHHVCFYEPARRLLFAGDAVGPHGVAVLCPFTVPPRFDRGATLSTLRTLDALRPKFLAFTHFGIASDARALIRQYAQAVNEWLDHVGTLRKRLSDDQVIARVLTESRFAALGAVDQAMIRMFVRGALLSLPPAEADAGHPTEGESRPRRRPSEGGPTEPAVPQSDPIPRFGHT